MDFYPSRGSSILQTSRGREGDRCTGFRKRDFFTNNIFFNLKFHKWGLGQNFAQIRPYRPGGGRPGRVARPLGDHAPSPPTRATGPLAFCDSVPGRILAPSLPLSPGGWATGRFFLQKLQNRLAHLKIHKN